MTTHADIVLAGNALKQIPGVSGVRDCIEGRLTIGNCRADAILDRILADLFELSPGRRRGAFAPDPCKTGEPRLTEAWPGLRSN